MTSGYYVSGDDLVCKNCRELLGQLEGVHDIYLKVIKQSIETGATFQFSWRQRLQSSFIYIFMFEIWNIYVYCTQFQLKLISSLHFSTLQFSTKIHRCNSKIKKRNEKHTWLSAPYVNTERFYWHIPDHQSCQRSSRGEPVYSPSLWCWWQIEPHCKREPVYKQCILRNTNTGIHYQVYSTFWIH